VLVFGEKIVANHIQGVSSSAVRSPLKREAFIVCEKRSEPGPQHLRLAAVLSDQM
jgi:hypothetical protein